LLYLTELRSFGIVVGKAFVHLLRSVSMLLTMAPWLMLPVLFGGIELRDVGMALLRDSAAVLLALAAGLLASTFPRDWLKSVILAELFAAVLLLAMLHVHGSVLRHAVTVGTPAAPAPGTQAYWTWNRGFPRYLYFPESAAGKIAQTSRLIELTTSGSFHASDRWYGGYGGRASASSDWQQIWTGLTPAGHNAWLRGVIGMVVGAGLVLLAAMRIGAWRVARSWRDAPQSVATLEWRRNLLAPRFGVRTLNRRLSRALTANPIGWLHYHSPSARLVKWAWCLFIIMVEIVFSANTEDLYWAQSGLAFLLLLGLAFSATASFREEVETGAFELLLVTSLREWQIIIGRVRGLWWQFLPAILIYGAGSIYLVSGWSDRDLARNGWLALARTMTGCFTLPFIGLYFSVQRWNFFVAWLAACLLGLLPSALGRAFGTRESYLMLLQIGVAVIMAALLHRRLCARRFLRSQS